MSKIVEIEDALKRISGDNFQELCNHFLFYKLNPNSIDPIGSVIGKEKSRKGIPDSYFTTSNNELIFAEYTTKEKLEENDSFIKKLKKDIENCFDESKTHIKPDEIKRIILCFTDRLKPNERKELQNLCNKYNSRCNLELIGIRDLAYAILDYPLLGEYLGIKISTGQIQNPSEFIADYEKSKLSTPLSNTFYGRKEEIESGLKKINEHDILLIHGAPGTGKSKYAIELCKKFSNTNKKFKFLCIGNKGLPIWEDLKKFLRRDKSYLILIDDANRLAKNYQWILSLLNDNRKGTIKIIVTVRDYALSQVQSISKDFIYSAIEIKELSKKDVEKIIKSKGFNINEPVKIERIIELSRGNARLAIMCAKVALTSKNIMLLNDASQIYEEYYSPIFEELPLLNEKRTLQVLAVISFFGKIDKSNHNFCNAVFSKMNLDENFFWETCYILNEHELVDLFEEQVVKISDQIFATYIFYKAVIDLELIKFSFFLDNYLDYEYRINDTIIPVLRTFNYKKIEEKLKPLIVIKWHDIEKLNNYEKSLKYLDLFWYYLFSQALVFFKKHIDGLEEPKLKSYRYNYEVNEFSHGTGKLIEILSRFQYLEPDTFKDALELLFYYGIKIPDKLPALVYTLKERFAFTRFGYRYGDYVQHIVLDFLIEKAESSNNKNIFENILLEVIPKYLKIENREYSGNGREITIYTFHLWLSESIKLFRKKCFDYIDRKAVFNKQIVNQIIYNLSIFEYKHSNEIYLYDKEFIFILIEKYFNPNEFEDCFVFQEFIEKLELLKKDYPKELKKKFHNKSYQLTELLKCDRYRRRNISWQEEEKIHEKELIDYCKDFILSDYINLFNNVSLILNKATRNNIEWQYYNSLAVIIGNTTNKDYKLFFEVLKEAYQKFDLKINYLFIFNIFFRNSSKHYLGLYSTIKNFPAEIKLNYHQSLVIESVLLNDTEYLYSDLKEAIRSIEAPYFFWDLTFISKYAVNHGELFVYKEISELVLKKIKEEDIKINVGEKFLEKCLHIPDFPFENIVESYLYAYKFKQHFDHNKEILRILVEKDNKVILEFLKFILPDRISYHNLEHEDLEFIWELDNYNDIMKSLIDFFLDNNEYRFGESAINAFFLKNNNKYDNRQIPFLESMIKNHFSNEKYMGIIFNIICYSFTERRDEFLKLFLSLNSDIKMFKNIEVIKQEGVYTGSRIPYIENYKSSWSKALAVINSMPNRLDFIEHKEYVNKQIDYCSLEIQREMKSEFLDDFR